MPGCEREAEEKLTRRRARAAGAREAHHTQPKAPLTGTSPSTLPDERCGALTRGEHGAGRSHCEA